MQHYVILHYPDDSDIERLVEQLRADDRFVYIDNDRGGGFSAYPDDPLFQPGGFGPWPPDDEFQWYLWTNRLNLPEAWDHNTGWAHVGVVDSGVPAVQDNSLNPPYRVDHYDLFQVVSRNHSWRFAGSNSSQSLWWNANLYRRAHGTHVLGIIAANANNNSGIAGTCWHCSALIGHVERTDFETNVVQGISWLAKWGSQVINFSGNISGSGAGHPCESYNYGPASAPACQALGLAKALEVNVVAASGNNKGPIDFPARDLSVIAVGGYDINDVFWDEQLWMDPWDYPSGTYAGCPNLWNPPFPYQQCGSNFGSQQHFVTPSRRIVSAVPYGVTYVGGTPPNDYCNDANFGTANDGVAYCTGTSMSAPQVSGIAALIRSVNPLLDRVATFTALKETASNPVTHNTYIGWGSPNAGEAVKWALGRVAGVTARNRLTPMFALTIDQPEPGGAPNTRDRLYTTRPQVVAGALSGLYLAHPRRCVAGSPSCIVPTLIQTPRYYQNVPPTEAGLIGDYSSFPGFSNAEKYVPRSAFWVLTSSFSPWSGITGVTLKPLYRLSFRHACDWRDHAYTTEQAGIDYFTQTDFCPADTGSQTYQLDGIEGYILATCPAGMTCNGSDPSEPQKLYRRYSYTEQRIALILQNQLGSPPFTTYTTDPWGGGDGFLGYVFPNIDTDGDTLPDGMERMLGMNPLSPDSDCDGKEDGAELPLTQLQPAGHDPLLPNLCP